jgi:hypothetical protein
MCGRNTSAVSGILLITASLVLPAHGALNPLAFYHLGDADPGAAAGGAVANTVESLGLTTGIDMAPAFASNDLKYSSDKPSFLSSTLSIAFDDGVEHLISPATPWYQGTGGFRWGMEVFLKPDPSLAGTESVFFTNGTQFTMGITDDGFFYVNQTIDQTTSRLPPRDRSGRSTSTAFLNSRRSPNSPTALPAASPRLAPTTSAIAHTRA